MKISAIGEILFDVYPDYKKLGGAPFNFLYHVWKLTGDGIFISRIGNDEEGKEILNILEEINFNISQIQVDNEKPTGRVNVKLDKNKVPEFEIVKDRAYDFIEITEQSRTVVDNSDLFYFGSLAQRNEKSKKTITKLVEQSKRNFCDLNIRQNFYDEETISNSLHKSDVVKLNSDELKLVNEFTGGDEFNLEQTAKAVAEKFQIDLLCITLGADGALLLKGEKISHHKETAEKIVDTVGAGDAYAAILAIGYQHNWPLTKVNELASKFSAAICEVEGAIPSNDAFYNKYREMINND